jgi:ABC-type Fe3+/spermidine/putrescine transport system ATPase subunit
MSTVEIQGVAKSYGTTAVLRDVHLTLPDGSMTAVLGPSGCGKTTLLRIIAGFISPDKGAVRIDGQDVTHLPTQKRGAAMVFQNYALWPHMSIYDNIAYGLKLQKLPKDEIAHRVHEALKLVELDVLGDPTRRKPPQLSGGQQQRVALARALAVRPKLLLLDEPLSNLDAKVRQRLRVEIRRLQQSLGITALYVTHDQEEALSMADQVVLMNGGIVEQAGPPEEVYRQPRSVFVADFLGTTNVLRNGDQTLVFRAGDATLLAPGATPERLAAGDLCLTGELQAIQFTGVGYRHVLKTSMGPVMVDHPVRLEAPTLQVHVTAANLWRFGGAAPAAGLPSAG